MGDEAAGALVGSSWPIRLPRVVGALFLLLTAIAVIGQIAHLVDRSSRAWLDKRFVRRGRGLSR